jgi:hypothetical protein
MEGVCRMDRDYEMRPERIRGEVGKRAQLESMGERLLIFFAGFVTFSSRNMYATLTI